MCILRRCATPFLLRHHLRVATLSPAPIHLLVLPGLPPSFPCRRYRSFRSSSPIPGVKKVRAMNTVAEVFVQEGGGANGGDGCGFFAEEGVSWKSLGISESLCRALSGINIHQPSQIQAAAIPHVLTGNDVIIAAETGSGKTHGYLVPLIHKLCPLSDDIENEGVEASSVPHRLSLVLCPNVMLCEQVAQMANCLVNESGGPLVRVAAVCGRQGWPLSLPNILVSTPVALLNGLFALDTEQRRRAEFIRDVKCIVFDEADMLLCGSFENQIIRLINMFRFEEKQLSRNGSSGDSLMDVDGKAHVGSGLEDDNLLEHDGNYEEESDNGDGVDELGSEENKVEASSVKDWRRVRKVYKRSKQYIFVAATLPVNGKKTAGGVLKRMFPDAVWVSGNYLHRQNPRLEQRWLEVTHDTQVDSLLDAVKCLPECSTGNNSVQRRRVMVFANTVDAVESVANILRRVGYECNPYHSESSLEERTKNLTDFRENGGILVCTDAAARGIDVPNVMHVIQAEFATCAIDFLHRIGRTARAGQSGLVTSLYTNRNRDLVAAVRQAVSIGLPVEKAFSRKRSFRNKLKKKGREAAESKDRILA